ncbi:ribose ABC transporter substrate-binding protein RbsB [Sporosarcina soli]|uniref:Ribose ABC transporter substrate-binding protein RbsB n=1 Tax=Sporosarcina soli TaxID=334736 RepID=A0ABW0TJD1_9BACL
MKKWMRSVGVFVLLVFLLAACSTDQPGTKDTEEKTEGTDGDVKIGFSISTLNNPFFVSLRDGAQTASDAAGYKIVVVDAQDDPSKQINDIEDLLQQDIDVLLVNPTDTSAVVAAIESANQAGIPVITVDRSADGGDVIAHIASDNILGGEMAGQFIADHLTEGGNVVELEGIPGVLATRERGEGFHNIVDAVDNITVAANQTADFDRTKGLSVMENIIQGTKDIVAVFAHNDEMALGAIEALEAHDMLQDVIVVGFDANDDARIAVKEGRMAATVAQQPELISKYAIETATKVINGEKVDEFIPVELQLVTE